MCVKPRIRKISVAGCGLINSRVLWLQRRASAASKKKKKTKWPQKQPFERGSTSYNGVQFDGQESCLFRCIFYVVENSKINCMSTEAETMMMRQWRCSILRKEERTRISYVHVHYHFTSCCLFSLSQRNDFLRFSPNVAHRVEK